MGKILRRTFLIGAAAIAGGVAFGAYQVNKTYPNPLEDDLAEGENTFNPYVQIASDNTITIMIPRAEMGQGVSTTLAALVAEELDVSMDDIQTEIAPASYAYYNSAMLEDGAPVPHFDRSVVANVTRSTMGGLGKILGLHVTGGSSSIKDGFERLRMSGCAARETLKLAAANRSGVSVDQLKTENATVVLPDGKTMTYGELAADATKLDVPSDIKLRERSEWKVLGKSTPRRDMVAKSTGAPIFGVDVVQPDMLYGTIRMNPRLGGPMVKFDATEALKIKGVLKVVDITGPENEAFGGGIGVIATNTWAAFKGAEAVDIEWGEAPYPADTDAIIAVIEEAVKTGDGDGLRDDGDVDLVFADAPRDRVVEAEYRVPFLAHTTMEPMNATAQLKDGRLDIWTGTQAPTIIRSDCAYEAGIEEENTFIHSTYLGGGFGRRGEVDFPRYAARLAKETDGKPVKVTWSREEDTTHDTYRPAAIGKFRAVIGDDNLPRAVDMRIAAPSIVASLMARTFPSLSPAGPDNSITDGSYNQPYGIKDYRVSGIKAPVDIPVGFWRSVGHSYNGFFHEGFMDELAVKGGIDPLEMRLKVMADHPVALGVLNKVAEMSNWSAGAPAGRSRGLAFNLSFGTWVAQVVEISMPDDEVKIENVWCAADLGEVMDPAITKTQMQSGIIYGLSSCIGQEITFDDGMVEQTNFDSYDALRMNQCPTIHVELLENADHMGGAGEPGMPAVVPALGNAIFAATGKRLRSMPFSNEVDFFA
ncbi:MAG: molybdopterin cofactor-binding domain-containing protein [Pseudomonadota bacterium]